MYNMLIVNNEYYENPTFSTSVAELILDYKEGKKTGKDPNLERWQKELVEMAKYVLDLEETKQYDLKMVSYFTNDDKTSFRLQLFGEYSVVRGIIKTLYDAYNPQSSLRDRKYYVADPIAETFKDKIVSFFNKSR